jgi:hypothetical protein
MSYLQQYIHIQRLRPSPPTIACKNNETLHILVIFFTCGTPPAINNVEHILLISPDLKIVLTTLHKGEEGKEPLLQEGGGQ